MSKKYQNIFFIFGAVVLAFMITRFDFEETWNGIRHAGYWFVAVLLLWAVLYVFNSLTWYIIIRSGDKKTHIPFWWLYKITISGFALNYATPGGLMGGEPYRVMALSPLIGTERASSTVILYAMTHIFSHFIFWLMSVALFIATEQLTSTMSLLLALITAFCLIGIWFFMTGYRKGLANRLARLLEHIPGLRDKVRKFVSHNSSKLEIIDQQIAALHSAKRLVFVLSVLLELAVRICSAAEIMFVLLVITPDVDFVRCILILAFTSLLANILFFMPLQLGGREGGFMLSTAGLSMTAGAGAFVALIVRLRELVWTAVGLLLIKVDWRHK